MLDYSKVVLSEIRTVDEFNVIGERAWTTEFFSPHKPRSFVFQCKDGDRVVGCEGYIDYQLFFQGELCQTHRSERTLVSPSHRGKGIFEALVRECDRAANAQHSHMCWGSTPALKPFGRAGFDQCAGFRNYIFYPAQRTFTGRVRNILSSLSTVDPFRLYRIWKNRNLEEIKKTLGVVCLLRPQRRSKSALQIVDFDEALVFDMLRRHSESSYAICPNDELFLWLSEKNHSYTRHCFLKDGACIGYVIFKMNPATKLLHIVDLFSADPDCIVAMIDKLADKYSHAGMNALFLALNGKNPIHGTWIQQLRAAHVWVLSNLGSFVIRTLAGAPKKIEIQDLLLTDLWLEL
jgi:GNAT superfamily N-acetyltransferase